MLRDLVKNGRYRTSKIGRRVDRTWNETSEPILICAMSIRHSIVNIREDLEIVISATKVFSRHRTIASLKEAPTETSKEHPDTPEDFASKLRSIGVLDLVSSSDMGLFDGSWATVVSRDKARRNIFSNHSIDTPQARATSMLLEIARPENYWAEQAGGGQAATRAEST